jgi:UDP-N-acetylmuramate--alanine ligase
MNKIRKIHFMGIGGSGMAAAALLAVKQGYEVSGCDLQESTAYSKKMNEYVPKIFVGHDKSHVCNVDALIVTPAVLFINKNHPEVVEAKKRMFVMTWEEFLGKYLQKGKEVIAIAGTHGKSTTTALLSLIFEKAGKDPSVVVGGTLKEWGVNSREGKSNIFVTEADEFYDNFLNYTPSVIILNNIEYDHPDFFKTEDAMVDSFAKFVRKLERKKILVVNQDSIGIKRLFAKLGNHFLKILDIYGYTFGINPIVKVNKTFKIKLVKKNGNGSSFLLQSKDVRLHNLYHISMSGEHNVANSAGVIILSKLYGISDEVIQKVLSSFGGIGRRMELIGESRGIRVYDDYAHHPTAIRATLSGLRQKYPKARIWAIIEAHSYSRTKALLSLYKNVFEIADKVIVGPIFKARDNQDFGISGQSIINVADHKDSVYLDSIDKIVEKVKREVKSGDIILIMGAGESYKWARQILSMLS